MGNYLSLAFGSWLTPIYLIILAVLIWGVIENIVGEERLPEQVVGSLVLVPLLLRLFLIK